MRLFTLAILLVLAGCSAGPPLSADTSRNPRVDGYTLLGTLLADEARVGGILTLRKPSKETEELIRAIADRCSTADRDLKAFDVPRAGSILPEVDVDVRAAIAGHTGRELVFGDMFEVRLLLSQAEALRYGRYLAIETAKHEPDASRNAWLKALAEDLAGLRTRVVQRLAVKE